MMRALFTSLLIAGSSVLLGGCALQPLYSGGSSGVVARNALTDRLEASGGDGAAKYRLDVRLDDDLEGLGVLADDTISRERRTLRARYQLIELASGAILLDATAGSDAGIDVVSSEYATIAAEQRALENLAQELADQMVTRIALTLREGE
jgi:LPS-assembly lipoprotein